VQTDNSFLGDKVKLRRDWIEQKSCPVKILDAFSGNGLLWKMSVKHAKHKPIIDRVDIKDKQQALHADSAKFMQSVNLKKYQAIDLDAYGVPFQQLKEIFDQKYVGVVFVTVIRSVFGRLPTAMLLDLGYTQGMIAKCPTLICGDGFQKFEDWIAKNGVKKYIKRGNNKKLYGMITMNA